MPSETKAQRNLMATTPTIELLFPTPIMFNNMDRKFTAEEIAFIDKHSDLKMVHKNPSGNATTINTYVLNEPEMKSLHDICLAQVKSYIDLVIKPKYKVEPFITQSWINYNNKGESHRKHQHPNSFLSGVLYISANPTEDKITFHKGEYKQIYIPSDSFDIMNSDSWWFNVDEGKITIFPSNIAHHVEDVVTDETRISLAFNTFLKGTLGENRALTELINL
jgi:hypothetical protein